MPKQKFFKIITFHVFIIAIIVLSFYYFDYYFLNLSASLGAPTKRFFAFIRNLQDGEYLVITCALLLATAFFLRKFNILRSNKHLVMAKISLYTISTIVISSTAAHIIKFTTGRPRPNLFIHTNVSHLQWFEFDNSLRSFPSAHTAAGISILIVLFCLATKSPLWRFLLFLISGLFAISHTMIMAHWFSDIIVGGYITALTVLWLQSRYDHLYEKLIHKILDFNKNKKISSQNPDL